MSKSLDNSANKFVVVYLPKGFADWEGSFLLPELRETKIPVKIISEDGKLVTSIGGLHAHVDGSLDDLKPELTEALVLIGSDSWSDANQNQKALKLAAHLIDRGVLVGAICAATVGIARMGLLENRKHTSNDLGILKQLVPSYKGDQNYIDQLVVRDDNLITAPGVGYLEFTLEFMKAFNIYSEKKRQQWYDLFRSGTKPPAEFWG